jgi:excisionase family DNA binding protein
MFMAGMFYSIQEAAEKLKMTPEQLQQIVNEGKLREFRDGANVLLKVDEVEALAIDDVADLPMESTSEQMESPPEPELISPEPELISPEPEPSLPEPELISPESELILPEPEQGLGEPELESVDEEISLAPEPTGGTVPEEELIDIDTFAGSGVEEDLLAETDGSSALSDDLMMETKGSGDEASLEEIEEDVNLDTFGSGSGLLDLSLQADDTSLGGILDEIYTSESGQETSEGPSLDEVPDAEPMLAEEDEPLAVPGPTPAMPAMVTAYAQQAPDAVGNALGWMLILPLLAIAYTAIVSISGAAGFTPGILEKLQGTNGPGGIHVVWYGMGVLALAASAIAGGAAMLSGSAAKPAKPKKAKQPKQKKVKQPKPKKPKKPKKEKKKKKK